MSTVRASGLLAFTLLMGGCASIFAPAEIKDSRDKLVGTFVGDLLGCAGIPDHVIQSGPDEILLQYEQKPDTKSAWLKVPVPFPGVSPFEIGGTGESCDAHFRVWRNGTVLTVGYSGSATPGANTTCGKIIGECDLNPDQTTIPKGYDAFILLGKPPEKAKP